MLKSPLVRFKIFKFINHIQTNIMENKDKDLGDKKMNGKQSVNEGFSGENIANDFSNKNSKLKTEIETVNNGSIYYRNEKYITIEDLLTLETKHSKNKKNER
mgnify:CR=1 FL=1